MADDLDGYEPGGLVEAASRGDRKALLVAIRDFLVSRLEDAPATAVAPMVKQLSDVLRQLEESGGQEGDTVDEFTARRQARIAAAQGL